jgi:phosphoribosylformylglycinamidine cyclo-ligase
MATVVKSDAYKAAGVDIDLAQKLLGGLKGKLAKAKRPEMLAPIGGFGGLFAIDLAKYKEPVMVSSIDGVGTKLEVAMKAGKFDGVGHDIVNHCVNDIAVQGAEPVYFLDYIGTGKLRGDVYEAVLSGVADACINAGCALLGGETAEMPGMYGDDFDLVGVITGIVEKSQIITGEKIAPGHVAVGLKSSGLHTNGFSLARKILFDSGKYTAQTYVESLGETVGEALLHPHVCYYPAIRQAMNEGLALDGIAHITGGGLYDNVPRILPEDVSVIFRPGTLPVPPIFKLLTSEGNVGKEEAYRVFNMGVGMVWFVPKDAQESALEVIRNAGFTADVIGEVVPGKKDVQVI